MFRKIILTSVLASSCALLLAGCPSQTPTPISAFAGTWLGEIQCAVTQRIGDAEHPQSNRTPTILITVRNNGVPESVALLGFSGNPDVDVNVSVAGTTQTLNSSTAILSSIAQTVTVTAISIDEDGFAITLDVDYAASHNNFSQEGSGTVLITATFVNDALTYTVESDFDVAQITGSLRIETGERISCSGTLVKQP